MRIITWAVRLLMLVEVVVGFLLHPLAIFTSLEDSVEDVPQETESAQPIAEHHEVVLLYLDGE